MQYIVVENTKVTRYFSRLGNSLPPRQQLSLHGKVVQEVGHKGETSGKLPSAP